ncbi:8965_t:CDS:2 [Acaulospora morrowiae]|uniref:8965_t:CDS:1 n=1 Tax=Acaulospora morrowiae TaxID=94023 RepID=A0A9N9GHP8_9GLOM|nr:8965_t:CDS:2 [Acaulospora morrowiae]
MNELRKVGEEHSRPTYIPPNIGEPTYTECIWWIRPNLPHCDLHTTFYLNKNKSNSPNSEVSPDISPDTTIPTRLDPDRPADRRLLISFTCKVCLHRSTKTMSKLAYEQGVVLIECPSCLNRHLIADHLGYFRDKRTTVEDLMLEQGEKIVKIVGSGEYKVFEGYPRVIQEEEKKLKEAED